MNNQERHEKLDEEQINLDDEKPSREVSIKLEPSQFDAKRFDVESMICCHLNYFAIRKEGKFKKVEHRKHILHDINLDIKMGCLTAILGPSGAGKTTLLNFMALRVQAGTEATGLYIVNNKHAYKSKSFRRSIAYILQEDILIPYLTVRETLDCAARLKLPKQMPEEEKMKRVEQIMAKLGLVKCANTIVGDPLTKGISGGEKKRLSIAMELITKPSVLFVDEPTTGLDTVIAYDVIKILQDLAQNDGVTVITTIHQPSSEIFHLFDNVLLMKDGKILSYATANDTMDIFKRFGVGCPAFTNPADHLLITAMDRKNANQESLEAIKKYYEEVEAASAAKKVPDEFPKDKVISTNEQSFHLLHKVELEEDEAIAYKEYKNTRPGWFYKFKTLLHREWRASLKDPQGISHAIVTAIIMGLIVGLIFLRIGTDSQKSIQDRVGALLFLLIQLGMGGMHGVVATFAFRRAVFFKEYLSKQYGVSPFFFSILINKLPVEFITPLIFLSVSYFMIGFQARADNFFIFLAVILLIVVACNGFGYAIAASASTIPNALAMVSPILLPLILVCGFFLNSNSIPKYLIWAQYISPFKYGYEIICVAEFSGLKFVCKPDELESGVCAITTGEQALARFGYQDVNLARNWIVLAALAVTINLVGFLILYSRTARYKKQGKI